MTACRDREELVLRVVDGDASPSEQRELAEHVAICAACREDLELARSVDAQLAALVDDGARADVDLGLGEIRARIDARSAPRWSSGLKRAAAVLLVATIGAALVLWIARSRTFGTPIVVQNDVAPRRVESSRDPAPATSVRSDAEARSSDRRDAPPLEPAPDPQEDARLAAARDELAAALRASPLDDEPVAFARDVERRAVDVARAGFRLVRLAEDCVRGADADLARRGLRYVAVRGDQLSVEAVRAATRREELASDAWTALAILRPERVDLAASPELESALRAIRTHGSRVSVDSIEAALLRAPEDRVDELFGALAAIGTEAVRPLLRVVESRPAMRDRVRETLAGVPGAGDELARLSRTAHPGLSDATLLDAFAWVPIAGPEESASVAWIVARTSDARSREAAIQALSRSRSARALSALCELVARDPREDVEIAARSIVVEVPERAAELARDNEQRSRRLEQHALLDVLTAIDDRAAVPGLLAIACGNELSSGDRRLAALACCDIATQDDVPQLVARYESLVDRDLRAALLVALRIAGGEAAVDEALAHVSPRTRLAIQSLLDDHELGRHGVHVQTRVARELARRLAEIQA